MSGESHHVVVTSGNIFYSYGTNPLLHSVGACLVGGVESAHIVLYHLFGKIAECHFRLHGECHRAERCHDSDTGHDFMGFSRNFAQHFYRIFVGGWLPEDLLVEYHRSVGGD